MHRMLFSPVLLVFLASAAFSLPPPSNLTVTETGEGWVRLRWNAPSDHGLKGYRIEYSLRPGEHPAMTDWNGYPAAFSFTTDDGFRDNLVWAKVFDRHDRDFTLYVIPARVGHPGYLTEADLNTLHEKGHEIASHSFDHPVLIRNTAFTIRYTGPEPSCMLEIAHDTLRTVIDGVTDIDYSLSTAKQAGPRYIVDLVGTIDALPNYTCTLDYYPCRLEFCQSVYLNETEPVDIATEPFHETTSRGCDSLTLVDELVTAKSFLETAVKDSAYRCRSFAYPRHAHDQREMNAVMDAGYLSARNGAIGEYPGGSPVGYSRRTGVSLYQMPMTWGQPPNDSSEAWSREEIRGRIAAWKRDHEWANLWVAHSQVEWDSAHVDWVLDELVADGGVWVAPVGEIADYVRRFQVTVENPVEGWNDSLTASAPLHGLPIGPMIYAVVVAYDASGTESGWSNEVAFRATNDAAEVGDGVPDGTRRFALGEIRPSPMNPTAVIPLRLHEPAEVALRIYDVQGRLVASLLEGRVQAGTHEILWDGTDDHGKPVGSGSYFCRIDTPWGTASRRVDVIR